VKRDMLKLLKRFWEDSIFPKNITAITAKTLLKIKSTTKAFATGRIAEIIDWRMMRRLCIYIYIYIYIYIW